MASKKQSKKGTRKKADVQSKSSAIRSAWETLGLAARPVEIKNNLHESGIEVSYSQITGVRKKFADAPSTKELTQNGPRPKESEQNISHREITVSELVEVKKMAKHFGIARLRGALSVLEALQSP